ncbi:hypothetical protein BJ508DRAFT_305982 [Ascobolus immersus RN42]|uniref:Uncharacterized protein n=1 Tax=Ascobolus immersus RN42 TaxID=1160509 RepID=A0A3N4IKD0_ASCIM|nr:hypothetical protein BJ508DRAFT_305982 [Ascobolus immersus RN42]
MPPKPKLKQKRLADLRHGSFTGPRRSSLPTNHNTKQTDLSFYFSGVPSTKPTAHEDKENTTLVTFSKSTGRLRKTAPSATHESSSRRVSLPPGRPTKGIAAAAERLKRKTLSPQRRRVVDSEDEEEERGEDEHPRSDDSVEITNHRRIIHPAPNYSQKTLLELSNGEGKGSNSIKEESQGTLQANRATEERGPSQIVLPPTQTRETESEAREVLQQLQKEAELHANIDSQIMPPPPPPPSKKRPALKRGGRRPTQNVEIQEPEEDQLQSRQVVVSSQWWEREEEEGLQTQSSNLSNSSLELMRGPKRRRLEDEKNEGESREGGQTASQNTQAQKEDDSPLSECPPGLLETQQEAPNSYQDPPASSQNVPPPRLPTRQHAVMDSYESQSQLDSQPHDSIPATQSPVKPLQTDRRIILDSQFPDEDDLDYVSSDEHMDREEDSIPETQYPGLRRQPSTAPSTPEKPKTPRHAIPQPLTPRRTTLITTDRNSPYKKASSRNSTPSGGNTRYLNINQSPTRLGSRNSTRTVSTLGEVQVPQTQFSPTIQVPRTQAPTYSQNPPVSQLLFSAKSEEDEPDATFCPIGYEREIRRTSAEGNTSIRMPTDKLNFTQFGTGGTQWVNGGDLEEDEDEDEHQAGQDVSIIMEEDEEVGSQDTTRPGQHDDEEVEEGSQDTIRPNYTPPPHEDRQQRQGQHAHHSSSDHTQQYAQDDRQLEEQDSMLPTMSQLLPNSLMESFPVPPPALGSMGDWEDPDATQ